MTTHFTVHGKLRAQQRAIPELLVDLLLRFGASEAAGAGTSKFYFDKASRRKLQAYAGPIARLLDDHLDLYIVVAGDSTVITVAHRTERIQRH